MISRIVSKLPRIYPQAVTRMQTKDCVAITFDDGPDQLCTAIVLHELDNQGLKSTFFMNGSNVLVHMNIVRELHDNGHVIGNHGYEHCIMARFSESEIRSSIMLTNRLIAEATGVTPKTFRPPYGWFFPWYKRILDTLGMQLVLWSMMPREFDKRVTLQEIARTFMTIEPGEIIVLHTNGRTKERIRDVIKLLADSLREKKLQAITLSALENAE